MEGRCKKEKEASADHKLARGHTVQTCGVGIRMALLRLSLSQGSFSACRAGLSPTTPNPGNSEKSRKNKNRSALEPERDDLFFKSVHTSPYADKINILLFAKAKS